LQAGKFYKKLSLKENGLYIMNIEGEVLISFKNSLMFGTGSRKSKPELKFLVMEIHNQ
jgi:hypothetical protein